MEECRIEARVGGRPVVLTGHHPRYLLGFRGADLTAEPVVRLAASLPAGSIYIDVGANVGVTTIAVALSRPDLRVVALEPVPSNAECLRRNLASNGIGNCTMVNAAVGSAEGHTTINEDGPWSRAGLPGPVVPVVTLDGWCAQPLADVRVGLIKIDVEGCEPHVLAGAGKLIAGCHPPLFMELNPACLLLQGFNPVAFARYLLEAFEIEEQPLLDRDSAVGLIRDAIIHHEGFPNIVMRPRDEAATCGLRAMMVPDCQPPLASDMSDLAASVSIAVAPLRERPAVTPDASAHQDKIIRLEAEISSLRSSRSWRITAPLRAAHARFSRE